MHRSSETLSLSYALDKGHCTSPASVADLLDSTNGRRRDSSARRARINRSDRRRRSPSESSPLSRIISTTNMIGGTAAPRARVEASPPDLAGARIRRRGRGTSQDQIRLVSGANNEASVEMNESERNRSIARCGMDDSDRPARRVCRGGALIAISDIR